MKENYKFSQSALRVLFFLILTVFAFIIDIFLYEYFINSTRSTTKTWLVVVILFMAMPLLDYDNEKKIHVGIISKIIPFLMLLTFVLVALSMFSCTKDNTKVDKITKVEQRIESIEKFKKEWPKLANVEKIDEFMFDAPFFLYDLNDNTKQFLNDICYKNSDISDEKNNLIEKKSEVIRQLSNLNLSPIQIGSLKADLDWYNKKIFSCSAVKKIYKPLEKILLEISNTQFELGNLLPFKEFDKQQINQIEKKFMEYYSIPVNCDDSIIEIDRYFCTFDSQIFYMGLFESNEVCNSLSNSLRINDIAYSRECMLVKDYGKEFYWD